MAISFFAEAVSLPLKNRKRIRSWIDSVISAESKKPGYVNFIFCSDEYLLEVNRTYLNHDYYTDIITFDYCEDEHISGDLFISIDRVRDNAKELKQTTSTELHRVMVHGVLHLIGYGDKTPDDVKEMRSKEDYYLTLL